MAEEQVRPLRRPEWSTEGVTCCVWRALTGEGTVAATVPANPYACINVVAEGAVATADGVRLPDAFVTGPFSTPLETIAAAPLRSLSIVLEPWALRTWLGLEPAAMVDAVQDLHDLPQGAHWIDRFGPALRRCVEELGAIDAVLASLLAAAEAKPAQAGRLAHELVACGSPAEAARHIRCSARQFHRRFVRHFGLAPRVWLRLRRFETAVEHISANAPSATLAAVAQDAGYADHAHMSRQFRAVGAASPSAVRSALIEKKPWIWVLQASRARPR